MDKSGKFGEALMDLGKTHSLLFPETAFSTEGAREDSGVHPAGHASKGTLIWEVLRTAGSTPLDGINLDTVQVMMTEWLVPNSARPILSHDSSRSPKLSPYQGNLVLFRTTGIGTRYQE